MIPARPKRCNSGNHTGMPGRKELFFLEMNLRCQPEATCGGGGWSLVQAQHGKGRTKTRSKDVLPTVHGSTHPREKESFLLP